MKTQHPLALALKTLFQTDVDERFTFETTVMLIRRLGSDSILANRYQVSAESIGTAWYDDLDDAIDDFTELYDADLRQGDYLLTRAVKHGR